MRQDLATPRHPSDGGGVGKLVDGGDAVAGQPGRWVLTYTAGPLGVAVGGVVYLQTSPFWGWSAPQTQAPGAAGYTTVSTGAWGVELSPEVVADGLLAVRIGGRALTAGEVLTFHYGAGEAGALADRYAEEGARIWFAVDGDGDGVRAVVDDSPQVDVAPGPAAGFNVVLPSVVDVGESVPVRIAALDQVGNASTGFTGPLHLTLEGGAGDLPETVQVTQDGRVRVTLTPKELGVFTVVVTGPDGLLGVSNPMTAGVPGPRILWGDLHGHSSLSDGTGTPDAYFQYARHVAGLDVVALTDHDHWGMRPLSTHPELWEQIRAATARHHDPGAFVTLLGYEWTSWIHGHRHVLFFGDDGTICNSLSDDCASPLQLWAQLKGQPALTFAHHQAGGPIATNWDIPPDPVLEPLTEVVSVHGSSEAPDAPKGIYRPVKGHYVRDALDRGYRFGFVGSGDSHDGHPGLAHLVNPSGGLAAILAAYPNREAILDAMRARRVYATNGPRIILRTLLGPYGMGADVPADGASLPLTVVGIGAGPIDHIDVIQSGADPLRVDCAGQLVCRHEQVITGHATDGYLYVRLVQADGGAAWSSPFYFRASDRDETPAGPG